LTAGCTRTPLDAEDARVSALDTDDLHFGRLEEPGEEIVLNRLVPSPRLFHHRVQDGVVQASHPLVVVRRRWTERAVHDQILDTLRSRTDCQWYAFDPFRNEDGRRSLIRIQNPRHRQTSLTKHSQPFFFTLGAVEPRIYFDDGPPMVAADLEPDAVLGLREHLD
jgi:hypothetical protein